MSSQGLDADGQVANLRRISNTAVDDQPLPAVPYCELCKVAAYQGAAQKVAVTQLEKAGVRIASVLNQALGS